jgi:hypothetical protein
MTKRSQPQGSCKDSPVRTPEVERFFDLWRGEPELARTFIRNLARKLDEAEKVADANSCLE